jgi:hypothetical protein
MNFEINEVATPIFGFPTYEITNYGRVINLRTKRAMVLSPTMNGDLTVGLTKDGHQYRYSVKGLVARTYVSKEFFSAMGVESKALVQDESVSFNTPILLDGNKYNLYFENIVWRPRWFAWRYSNQFTEPKPWYAFGPIQDVDADIVYESYLAAAIENGLLCADIRRSIYEPSRRMVYPTYQRFSYVNKYTNL